MRFGSEGISAMKTGIAAQFAQIKSDYAYITKNYGDVDNYTEHQIRQHERLIAEPRKQVAFECIRETLQEIFEKGYLKKVGTLGHKVLEPLPLEDDRVKEMCLRWNLPFPQTTL